jgi:hypothetical protein
LYPVKKVAMRLINWLTPLHTELLLPKPI